MTDIEFLDSIEAQLRNMLVAHVDMKLVDYWRLQNLSGYGVDALHLPGTNAQRVTTYTLSIALSHARDNLAHQAIKALLR